MLPKQINDITAADIQNLIIAGTEESITLEFKSQLVGDTRDARKEFLADICALANTQGGDSAEQRSLLEETLDEDLQAVNDEIEQLSPTEVRDAQSQTGEWTGCAKRRWFQTQCRPALAHRQTVAPCRCRSSPR